MRLKNFIPLVILFYSFSNTYSQNNNEIGLRKSLEYYKNINNDSCLVLAKKLQHSKNKRYVIEAISAEAYAHYRKKDYKKAEEVSLKLYNFSCNQLKKSNEIFYHDGKISSLNRLFWIKKNQEDYNEAYRYLTLMHEANEESTLRDSKYYRNKLSIKTSKAIIKKALKMDNEAKKVLLSANRDTKSTVFKDLQNDYYFLQQKANINNSLGNSYMTLFDKTKNKIYIDSASFYYNRAYQITKHFTPKHKDSEIIYSFRKTEVLIAKKEYLKAIEEINKYSKISNGYHYKHREHFQKAICFHNLNMTDSTIVNAYNLINDKIEKCKRSKLITVYDILSKEYNKLNKIDSAFKYSQLTLNQYDLAKNNKEKTFNSLYKNDYREAQLLNSNIRNRESQKQRNIIIAFITLLAILSIMTFYFLRKEKKQKKELINEISNQKSTETEKKEYNIDAALENKILSEIEKVNINLDYLETNFSISTIAENLKTNSTYVSFVFNKHHDESFNQYFTKRKIDFIIEKLKSDSTYRKYSIQGLAEEIGYTNASAFSRAFKKHTGITPSVFLKTLEN